ncbi:hypothetical protein BC834DRAFT_818875 [Gloeopeniophorella convolvens]|nr:hypothetical protein BC834DRAFT_818875 [Gloeopeniophorella convolvens]
MRFTRHILSALAGISAVTLPVVNALNVGRSLHQHVEHRALLDICVSLDADVLANAGPLDIPITAFLGLDLCLCLSALPLAITTDLRLAALANIFGKDALNAVLVALINTVPERQHCSYPPHSKSLCQVGNPCGFDCDAPWKPSGSQCVCPPPYSVCNGVCGSFPHGCGSAAPQPPYKRLNARAGSIRTFQEALTTCGQGERICGVYHGSAAFECLNTDTTLDSCAYALYNPLIGWLTVI